MSKEKRELPYNSRLQRSVEERFPDVDVNNIRDTTKEVSAMITVAVLEEVFIVVNPSLTKAHRTDLKSDARSCFTTRAYKGCA